MLSHRTLIRISGLVWLLIGTFLLQFGVSLLNQSLPAPVPFKMWTHPLIEIFSPIAGNREYAAIVIIMGCFVTGLLKGRFVLSRSAKRGIDRILSLPNPSPIWKIYAPTYYLLILTMIGMGFIVRRSPLPIDIRAAIYMSIGFAMMMASRTYFTCDMGSLQELCKSDRSARRGKSEPSDG